MNASRSGRWLRTGATSLVLLLVASLGPSLLVTAPASAAKRCPSAAVGGSTVGTISVDGLVVELKRARLSAGGVLDAPPSARIAALVSDYLPLAATSGTTVILWHSRYGVGCNGTLNVLFDKQAGDTFVLSDATGATREYRIAKVTVVAKGKYREDWFREDGPRQITLVTCTGLSGGVFRKNLVITAVPV